MLFNSFDFILFFVVVLSIYWTVPPKLKWIVLLISSFIFYSYWNPVFTLLLLFTLAVSFFLGKYLIDLEDRNRSRKGLILGLVLTGASLFLFKYYDFFNTALSHFLALFGLNYQPRTLTLILPLGISFYTFQIMAYMIDMYKKTVRAEENFFKYALFICFFPQLIAGPIERARHLLPQLNKKIGRAHV